MKIEIVYLGEKEQAILTLSIPDHPPYTVKQAIVASNILQASNELLEFREDPDKLEGKVGIFGNIVSLEKQLFDGDRIEIYRSLKKDPKQARRERAKKKSNKK